MIKYAALISVLVVMSEGQRPPYAGTANRYPMVLPRFQEEQDRAEAAAAAASSAAQGTTASVGNRVGEENLSSTVAQNGVPAAPAVAPVSTSTVPPTTSELPVHALGQADFVDRIKTWPEDQRPFWYTNRQQIAAHLNPTNPENPVQPGVGSRSFFAGK